MVDMCISTVHINGLEKHDRTPQQTPRLLSDNRCPIWLFHFVLSVPQKHGCRPYYFIQYHTMLKSRTKLMACTCFPTHRPGTAAQLRRRQGNGGKGEGKSKRMGLRELRDGIAQRLPGFTMDSDLPMSLRAPCTALVLQAP
jgi:hypothetical protein